MGAAEPSARELRELREQIRRAGAHLSAWPAERRAQAIARAAELLLDARGALGAELRMELRTSSGLSAQGIEHGLQTTLGLFERAALGRLLAQAPRAAARAPELATVILAGNVFSAAARPVLLPLLCGVGVLAKASSADAALPRALQRALAAADAQLGAACAVVAFGHGASALTSELVAGAEVLSVYGSDPTIAAVRAAAAPGARVIAHGHGLGAIFVARSALATAAAARELAERAARDLAAYDQRGCLSPHVALVESGAACDARAFARQVADALAALSQPWPRGELPPDAAAEQLQWRGVAAAIGELHTHEQGAVSYEADGPLRPSPGYRNLAVYDCAGADAARAQFAQLGVQLKALAVAGDDALAGAAPYVCELGAMQTPPLDAALDGLHPLAGLLGP